MSLKKKTLKKAISTLTAITTVVWLSGVSMLAVSSVAVAAVPSVVVEGVTVNDGDLISSNAMNSDGTPTLASLDIYIAKVVGTKKFKRLILNPAVFNSYGHLSWGAVREVNQSVMDAFSTSALVRVDMTMDPSGKVYALAPSGDTGMKGWVNLTEAQFTGVSGTDVESIYTINSVDAGNYTTVGNITTTTELSTFYTNGTLPGGAVPADGELSVALSATTPASTTVPANATAAAADVVFTKVNLTAGPSNVTVTGMKVTRTGLSQNAAISSVKLFVDDVQVGTSQSLNSANQAVFSGISISVPANSTKAVDIAATMAASATYNGNIITLGLASAGDITTTANVSGSFPLNGNAMNLSSSVTIGTATLYNGSSGTRNTTDLTVDTDAADVRFTQVKITGGSAEGLKITQVTAVKNGTASASDVKDIKLVNDTAGGTVATVASLDSNGRAVFKGLNIAVGKGNSVELSILATMNNSGAGRTIAFDLHDGTAYTIKVVGDVYGFGITPTRNNFCAAAGTCTTQTINQGYLTVQKSSATPATGNVALGGSTVSLAAFDFAAAGESINVSSTQVTITPSSGGSAVDYTNVGIYNAAGTLVAGPQDGSTTTANTAQTLTFTDAYTVPIGTNVYYVKANISSSAVAGEKVQISIPTNSITAKGSNSGKTTYTTSSGTTVPPDGAKTANVMTIVGPALTVITTGTPIAGSVVVNAQDQIFANIDLDASSSGEDIKVTALMVQDTLGAGTTYTGVNNLDLYDGSTKLETSNSTSTNAATVTFTFKTPLQITKGTTKRLTLKADVVSTTGTSHRYAVDGTNATVSATGWGTGASFTVSYSGSGQIQTVVSIGILKVEIGADRAQAAQFVAGTTGNNMMSYKFTASYEPIDVTDFYIATTGTTANADIAKVKLYVNGIQKGNTGGYSLNAGGDAHIVLDSGTFVVPKDSNSTLTIKVDLADKTQLTSAATLEIGIGDATGVDAEWGANGAYAAGSYLMVATGQSSGTALTATNIDSVGDGSGNVAASFVQYMYDGVLTVQKNTSSPSGSSSGGSDKEVLRLDLIAVGDDITVNEMEFCVEGTATGVTGTGSVTLKSEDLGTTYATMTQANHDTYWDAVIAASTYYPMDPGISGGSCFSFGRTGANGVTVGTSATNDVVAFSTTLEVAAGATKTVKLFGDTTGPTTSQTLQINLKANGTSANAATAAGLTWEDVENNTSVNSTLTKNLPVSGGSLTY